jgi:hypothetical protein
MSRAGVAFGNLLLARMGNRNLAIDYLLPCWGHLSAAQQASPDEDNCKVFRREAMLIDVLIVILLLMLIGAFPSWPYSRSWGYYPSGGIGLILLIVIILLLLNVV